MDCETIPLLKSRLDRYVLRGRLMSGVRATASSLALTTRPLAETGLREVRLGQYDSLYRQQYPRVTKSHHGRNEGES